MAEFNIEEQWTIIKVCATLGKSLVDTLKRLSEANRKPSVCHPLVYKWQRRFSDGRNSTENNSRSGWSGLINVGLWIQCRI